MMTLYSALFHCWFSLHSILLNVLDSLPLSSHFSHVPCRRWFCHALLVTAILGSLYATYYYLWYTPLPVYVLDKLNLRPIFLPNIACDKCNNFSYPWVVSNEEFCNNQDVFLLILVASFHANMNARQAIRKSWGGLRDYRGKTVRTLFMFGHHPDRNLNNQMQYELAHYGDVIQADFHEDYRTLTNKSMMGLSWVQTYCPQAKYILKTDDDSFNVPQRFVDYLIHVKNKKFVGGYCFTVIPDRRQSSKFYVPESMFPESYYPTYCSGPGYVLSYAALEDILSVAPDVIYLPMEDVYVTGLCRVVARIHYTEIPGTLMDRSFMTPCNLATWVKNGHKIVPEMNAILWERAQEARSDVDCVERNSVLLVCILAFLVVWSRHLWKLTHSSGNL